MTNSPDSGLEDIVVGCLCVVVFWGVLNGWMKATVWLAERNSRVALIAAGVSASIPGALLSCALGADPSSADLFSWIYVGLWICVGGLFWAAVVWRLRQMRRQMG